VLPVVAGAYLGRWLDSLVAGYSVRWTVSLILLGVVVGAVNAEGRGSSPVKAMKVSALPMGTRSSMLTRLPTTTGPHAGDLAQTRR
jgi:Putative F0F1-ATPase subunit Ca2+/Mg2+ transporter